MGDRMMPRALLDALPTALHANMRSAMHGRTDGRTDEEQQPTDVSYRSVTRARAYAIFDDLTATLCGPHRNETTTQEAP